MQLGTWLREVTDLLSNPDTNVYVVADPRDVRVPGGVVYPARIAADRLAAGSYSVDWRVVLIAPGDTLTASDELGRLASDIDSRLGGLTWEATTVADPNIASDPIPALTATLTLDWED